MITEDYVSFEVAKLLKEKGFNAPCFAYYYVMSHKTVIAYDTDFPKNDDLCLIYANMEFGSLPTLQMAMKWLREEKGIAIIPILSSVLDSKKFLWDIKIVVAKTNETYSQGWIYEKYEKACETAIEYCLKNLI